MRQQTSALNEHMPSAETCKNKTQEISVIRPKKTMKHSKKTLQKIGQAAKSIYKPKMHNSKQMSQPIIAQ